jgi:hypothetical protein
MQNVKREFSDRTTEINKFFALLDNILDKEAILLFPTDGNRRERFEIGLTATLKSNMILLLYNFIESTMTNCLVVIHRAISDENCKYQELSELIQQLFTEFYYKNLKSNKLSDENILSHLRVMINAWALNDSINFLTKNM